MSEIMEIVGLVLVMALIPGIIIIVYNTFEIYRLKEQLKQKDQELERCNQNLEAARHDREQQLLSEEAELRKLKAESQDRK